jgi:hypothetical protein
MDEITEEPDIGFREETGALCMLGKKERILLKEVLRLALTTSRGRKRLEERFGEEGFKIAESLLKQMGVKAGKPI